MANDNHASYAKIGLTIIIGVVAIVLTLVYLGGVRGRGDEFLVETYYDKPVSGLSVGSPVNFRGVKVGEVREVSFVGGHYETADIDASRIYILMAMDRHVMGYTDETEEEMRKQIGESVAEHGLRASVTSSGITGLSRIECDYNAKEDISEIAPISWTPRHIYIPSKYSLFDNFGVAATKVMNQINRMDLNAAWSNINATVQALSAASESAQTMLESRQADVDHLIDDLSATAASMRDLTAELRRNPSLLIRERRMTPLEETE